MSRVIEYNVTANSRETMLRSLFEIFNQDGIRFREGEYIVTFEKVSRPVRRKAPKRSARKAPKQASKTVETVGQQVITLPGGTFLTLPQGAIL